MTGWQRWIAAVWGLTDRGTLLRNGEDQHMVFALTGEQTGELGAGAGPRRPLNPQGFTEAETGGPCSLGALSPGPGSGGLLFKPKPKGE